MDRLSFDLELKEVSDEGAIEGYGAIFNNTDLYGDRLVPGAFAKSLARHAAAKSMPLMLWQHNQSEPIGVWTEVQEDRKGLVVKGRLVMEVARAREVHALLKAGAFRGLSIGYETLSDQMEGNTRILKEVDLWEVSPVAFPANPKATVTHVKSARSLTDFARRLRDGEPPATKEFEDILREAGVPKALAAQIASVGYAKAIRSESEGKANDAALAILRDAVSAFQKPRT
jgi:uncharacterized protein